MSILEKANRRPTCYTLYRFIAYLLIHFILACSMTSSRSIRLHIHRLAYPESAIFVVFLRIHRHIPHVVILLQVPVGERQQLVVNVDTFPAQQWHGTSGTELAAFVLQSFIKRLCRIENVFQASGAFGVGVFLAQLFVPVALLFYESSPSELIEYG